MSDEKQETPMAPPAYTPIAVTIPPKTLEALASAPECPAWIRRLPLTLPLTHACLAAPTSFFLARSLSDAVLIASFFSFVLFSLATAGVARTTRRNEEARALAARSLAVGATTTILWPLIALLVLSPIAHRAHGLRNCAMHRMRASHHPHHHHHHHHMKHGPVRVYEHGTSAHRVVINSPVAATPASHLGPDATVLRGGADGSPVAVVFSSKGERVLIASGPDAAGHLNAAVAALTAGVEHSMKDAVEKVQQYTAPVVDKVEQYIPPAADAIEQMADRVVVSSKGLKALIEDHIPAADVSVDEQL